MQNKNEIISKPVGVAPLGEPRHKGITLIALIITIIVMLILVGVTITVALNGGLFKTAKDAAEKTNKAKTEEEYMAISVELMLEADELVEKYSLNCSFDYGSEDYCILADENVLNLYGYILEKYGTSYGADNLTLEIAIRAANNFYEIYNQEVERNGIDEEGADCWDYLADYNPNPNSNGIKNGFIFDDSINTEENNIKLQVLRFGFKYCDYNPEFTVGFYDGEYYIIDTNNEKYILQAVSWGEGNDSYDMAQDTESMEIFNLIYPGGSFPFSDMQGNSNVNEEYFKSYHEAGLNKLVKITEENENLLVKSVGDTKDYVGSIGLLRTEEGEEKAIICIFNTLIINSRTGEIVYINDEGKPNKSFL